MNRFKGILLLLSLLLASCMREKENPAQDRYPDGTPVTMNIGFGYQDLLDVQIGTKAEASAADESRVHDLYVMLFDSSGNKFYGRYFTYEHLISSLSTLDAQSNEGWYVENSANTRGVVKISTEAKTNCTLVLIANVSNTITALDGRDPVDRLADVESLSQLNNVKVTLEQEVVNRADLFLMLGTKDGLNTGEMVWGTLPSTYSSDYKVQLNALDAKVKFCIKYNSTNIDASKSTPRYWQVFNVPASSYLMPRSETPVGVTFFNTEEAYFEGTEVDGNDEVWQVFSFYMIENKQTARASIEALGTPNYYLRELQEKDYTASEVNGDWVYAPANGTYVQFDVVLGLTTAGIQNILDDPDMNHALTSEALFTIHLGDFTSSTGGTHDYDNYSVERSHAYTYYITIENSKKIYVEVKGDNQG
ncbi:MAG: DUF4906 domain-containing protein, partial [Bacteroidales bacterium]|nr:DUF4906 domain-containing protein [Bacteroidales bacterium]